MRGTLLTIVVLLGLLAGSLYVAWTIWQELAGTTIGLHGLIAMGLGGFFTLLLGGGLMRLVYYSSKHGYDDEAGHD